MQLNDSEKNSSISQGLIGYDRNIGLLTSKKYWPKRSDTMIEKYWPCLICIERVHIYTHLSLVCQVTN